MFQETSSKLIGRVHVGRISFLFSFLGEFELDWTRSYKNIAENSFALGHETDSKQTIQPCMRGFHWTVGQKLHLGLCIPNFIRETDLLFISHKFVKGFLAIIFLLLVISSWNVHVVCQRFLLNQKRNFCWILNKMKNVPIDPHYKNRPLL